MPEPPRCLGNTSYVPHAGGSGSSWEQRAGARSRGGRCVTQPFPASVCSDSCGCEQRANRLLAEVSQLLRFSSLPAWGRDALRAAGRGWVPAPAPRPRAHRGTRRDGCPGTHGHGSQEAWGDRSSADGTRLEPLRSSSGAFFLKGINHRLVRLGKKKGKKEQEENIDDYCLGCSGGCSSGRLYELERSSLD